MMGNALFLEVKILMDLPLFICLLSNKKCSFQKVEKHWELTVPTQNTKKEKETLFKVSFSFLPGSSSTGHSWHTLVRICCLRFEVSDII